MTVPAKDVPVVGTLMGHIEESIREKFIPALFGGEDINADFWNILGHSIKYGVLGIPDPRLSSESAFNNFKAASGELVGYLFGGSTLNYVGHRACVRKASLSARRVKMHVEIGDLARQKELSAHGVRVLGKIS